MLKYKMTRYKEDKMTHSLKPNIQKKYITFGSKQYPYWAVEKSQHILYLHSTVGQKCSQLSRRIDTSVKPYFITAKSSDII